MNNPTLCGDYAQNLMILGSIALICLVALVIVISQWMAEYEDDTPTLTEEIEDNDVTESGV